jgi:hypothetical protein
MAYNISALTDYLSGNASELLTKTLYGSNTLDIVRVVTGLKGKQLLPKMTYAATLKALGCGFTASGSEVAGNVLIDVVNMGVQDNLCVEDLVGSVFELQLKAGAKNGEQIPFEQAFAKLVTDAVAQSVENLIWMGDTTASPAGLINGFYTIITTANGAVDAGTLTLTAGSAMLTAVDTMIAALPADVQGASDLVMFMNPANFAKVAAAVRGTYGLLSLTNSPVDVLGNSFVYPGTSVTIVKAFGLGTSNRFFLGQSKNFIVGTDLVSDYEGVDLWYSQDDRINKMEVRFRLGVAVVFYDQMVISANA